MEEEGLRSQLMNEEFKRVDKPFRNEKGEDHSDESLSEANDDHATVELWEADNHRRSVENIRAPSSCEADDHKKDEEQGRKCAIDIEMKKRVEDNSLHVYQPGHEGDLPHNSDSVEHKKVNNLHQVLPLKASMLRKSS